MSRSEQEDLRAQLIEGFQAQKDLNLPPGWKDIGGVVLPPPITLEEWGQRQDELLQQPDTLA